MSVCTDCSRSPRGSRGAGAVLVLLSLSACATASSPGDAESTDRTVYRVYVAAESADLLHRVRFDGRDATVENTVHVGDLPDETDGPHGLRVSPDGETLYLTTAHGLPDGRLWRLHAGPDTVMGPPIALGRFPATLDLTPDGLYAFVANFNLHGAHEPSTISTVYTPDGVEVAQTETCIMPHGARMHTDGVRLYSACMMDHQLVELDTRSYAVARRLSLDPGCSPTWTQPHPDGATVLVACNGADHLVEVDLETWRPARSLPTGSGPYNLAVTPDGSTAVVTLKKGHRVEFLDLASGAALGDAPTSITIPHGVVVSPDGRYAFVSVEGVGVEPGKVDVFDVQRRTRVASVAVGQQAGGIAFWRMESAGPDTGSSETDGR